MGLFSNHCSACQSRHPNALSQMDNVLNGVRFKPVNGERASYGMLSAGEGASYGCYRLVYDYPRFREALYLSTQYWGELFQGTPDKEVKAEQTLGSAVFRARVPCGLSGRHIEGLGYISDFNDSERSCRSDSKTNQTSTPCLYLRSSRPC